MISPIFVCINLTHFIYFTVKMSSPLAMILTQNKLTGENYVDWKRNLDIVLTAENYKIILTKPYPIEPIEESDKEDKEAYKTWM